MRSRLEWLAAVRPPALAPRFIANSPPPVFPPLPGPPPPPVFLGPACSGPTFHKGGPGVVFDGAPRGGGGWPSSAHADPAESRVRATAAAASCGTVSDTRRRARRASRLTTPTCRAI